MVNSVVLIGRITKDLELKQTTSNNEVVSFTIAVNRNFKNQNGEYDADFINCVAFGQTARFMANYLAKGRLISVEGSIRTRNYENNMGQRVYVTEVVANNVNGLESRNQTQQNPPTYNQNPAPAPVSPGPQASYEQNPMPTPPVQEQTPYDFMNIQTTSDIDESDLPF